MRCGGGDSGDGGCVHGEEFRFERSIRCPALHSMNQMHQQAAVAEGT
jgi:hypothetical protein